MFKNPHHFLKWYYDKKKKKNHFNFFSSDFETMFIKHSPSEIVNLDFEKMTVYLTAIFRFNGPTFLHQKGCNDVIYLECSM